MTTSWTDLAKLTGKEAKAIKRKGDGELARLIRFRLGARAASWNRLPLVVRVRAGGESKKAVAAFPCRTLDLAPPIPDLATLSTNGSHIVLDAALQRVVLVLYDWDALTLRSDDLDGVGIPASQLLACLERGARSPAAKPDAPDRWQVVHGTSGWTVHTGRLDGTVSPVVGRLALGTIPVDGAQYAVELLALPRLAHRRARTAHTVDLAPSGGRSASNSAAHRFLARTIWCTGTPDALLGMLRLAHRETRLTTLPDRVRLSTGDDPSPLAWLALADALTLAAEHQRRQYVRQREVRRAPVGTIRMGAWMNNIARQRIDQVPVARFLLSADCLENRLFRGVANHMVRQLRNAGELGAWMAGRFEAVEAAFDKARLVEPEVWMCETLLQRDLPGPIQDAVKQCRMALTGRYPGLDLLPGAVLTAQTFELDLAMLFEAAMRQLMRGLLEPHGVSVADGNVEKLGHGIRWLRGGGNNRLKPDLAMRRPAGTGPVVAVGDAKYKRERNQSSYAPLGRSDFQQLMTYMLAWPSARWGLVLMPWEVPANANAASHRLQELTLPDGRRLGVFQVDAARWGRGPTAGEPLALWLDAQEQGAPLAWA